MHNPIPSYLLASLTNEIGERELIVGPEAEVANPWVKLVLGAVIALTLKWFFSS